MHADQPELFDMAVQAAMYAPMNKADGEALIALHQADLASPAQDGDYRGMWIDRHPERAHYRMRLMYQDHDADSMEQLIPAELKRMRKDPDAQEWDLFYVIGAAFERMRVRPELFNASLRRKIVQELQRNLLERGLLQNQDEPALDVTVHEVSA